MRAFGLADETAEAGFQEVPMPEPGSGEVRVRVLASSINGWDTTVMSGRARGSMEHRYPVIGGKDYAGVVDAVGDGVTGFAVGDEVAGITPPGQIVSIGSFAEAVVVPAEGFIEPKPTSLSFEQAASVGLAALTALVAVNAVALRQGQTLFVVGATGGVGTYAVQLASGRGATVVATGLPEDDGWIRGLGADEVVDYSGDAVAAVRERHPEGVDALIVAARLGDDFGRTTDLVKDGGRVASAVGGDLEPLAARGVTAVGVFGQADPGPFREVLRMAGEGRLAVPITRTFGFDELPEALGLAGKQRMRGKLAVRIA